MPRYYQVIFKKEVVDDPNDGIRKMEAHFAWLDERLGKSASSRVDWKSTKFRGYTGYFDDDILQEIRECDEIEQVWLADSPIMDASSTSMYINFGPLTKTQKRWWFLPWGYFLPKLSLFSVLKSEYHECQV